MASRGKAFSQAEGLKLKWGLWQELASSIRISLLLHEAQANFLSFPHINQQCPLPSLDNTLFKVVHTHYFILSAAELWGPRGCCCPWGGMALHTPPQGPQSGWTWWIFGWGFPSISENGQVGGWWAVTWSCRSSTRIVLICWLLISFHNILRVNLL